MGSGRGRGSLQSNRGRGTPPFLRLARLLAERGERWPTALIIEQILWFLRAERSRGKRDTKSTDATLDVLAALTWALRPPWTGERREITSARAKALRELQREALRLLKVHDPSELKANRAEFLTHADFGRGLKSELEGYQSRLESDSAHSARRLADELASWLVIANTRVKLFKHATIDAVHIALLRERELDDFGPRMKVDAFAVEVLAALDVRRKFAWEVVNAADKRASSRAKKRTSLET